jgi:2-oxoglutarate ferredoxin oxidoreductase subunit alpha
VREAVARLQARGHDVKIIALRLLMPASVEKMSRALEGTCRVLVVEQSHGRQFYHYLRAYYDMDVKMRTLAKPGPLPIAPAEIVEKIENWR